MCLCAASAWLLHELLPSGRRRARQRAKRRRPQLMSVDVDWASPRSLALFIPVPPPPISLRPPPGLFSSRPGEEGSFTKDATWRKRSQPNPSCDATANKPPSRSSLAPPRLTARVCCRCTTTATSLRTRSLPSATTSSSKRRATTFLSRASTASACRWRLASTSSRQRLKWRCVAAKRRWPRRWQRCRWVRLVPAHAPALAAPGAATDASTPPSFNGITN